MQQIQQKYKKMFSKLKYKKQNNYTKTQYTTEKCTKTKKTNKNYKKHYKYI